MTVLLPLFGVVLVHRIASVAGRTWRDIPLYHSRIPIDPNKNSYLVSEDAWYANTLEPTSAPSVSAVPSPAPTTSRPPSQVPSLTPSVAPSNTPTVPVDPYPPNNPPSQPDPWYFNYNTTKGARFGPGFPTLTQSGSDIVINYENNYWGAVENPPYPYNTWLEFTDNGWGPWKGVLENRDPLANQCGKVGLQSPIDLVDSGDPCEESHEVRSRVSPSSRSHDRHLIPNRTSQPILLSINCTSASSREIFGSPGTASSSSSNRTSCASSTSGAIAPI